MKITINADRRTVLLRWLKNGTANINDLQEAVTGLNGWAQLTLGKDLTLELGRQEKIMILRWLEKGVIDIEDITASLPTFEDSLIQSGIINDDCNQNPELWTQRN